jgi:hypothetical protein
MGANYGKEATKSGNGALNIEAAALHDFSGGSLTDTVYGALTFGLQFKDSYKFKDNKEDTEVIGNLGSYNNTIANGQEYDYGGAWGLNLYLHYRKAFELGKFTVKITPNLNMDVVSQSLDYSIDGVKHPKPTWFTLEPGIQLGVKYQPSDKFAFFTGFDLRLLRWNTYATPGGDKDEKDDTTRWNLESTFWNSGTNNFRLGMAWTPIKGLVVSTGLTSLLNAFVVFDVQNMTVTKGTLFNDTNAGNVGDWALITLGKIFDTFELTVTWTF